MLRLLVLCLCLTASTAFSQVCNGADQRESLTPAEQKELTRRLENRPYPEGNLWQAQKGERTITLIGTLHVGGEALAPLREQAAPYVRAAEVLMVEATPEGERALQAQMARDPSLVFLTEGPSLIDLLPAPLWEKIAKAARERGIPGPMAAKFQPWFLSLSLALPACAMQEIASGAFGLDKQMMAVASDASVPVIALEDALETIALLSSDPLETQLEYLALGVYDSKLAEDGLATMTNLYLEGAHASSIEISRLLARRTIPIDAAKFDALFDEAMETLLDRRNIAWIDRIEAHPASVMAIAFGAGHLSGEQGILALLENRGYSLRPID